MWHPQGQALWHWGQGAAGVCAAVATRAQDRSHFVGVCDGAEQEAESSKPRSSPTSHAGVWGQMAPKQLWLLPEAEQKPACSCEVMAQGWGLASHPAMTFLGKQPRPGWVG